MNDERMLSRLQAASVAVLFSLGSILMFGGEFSSGPAAWLVPLISALMALPLWLVCGRLSSLYPRKSLFEIFLEIYGKIGGRILIGAYVVYVLNLCATVIRNYTEFMQAVAMRRTPQVAMALLLAVLAFALARKGVGQLGRFGFWAVLICLACIGFTVLSAIPQYEYKHLEPFLAEGIGPVLKDGLMVTPYSFGDAFLLIGVFAYMKQRGKRPLWMAGTLGVIALVGCLVSLTLLLVFGVYIAQMLNYPFYTAASLINVGDFLMQIEVLISGSFLLTGIVRLGVCFYSADQGLTLLTGTKSKGRYLWIAAILCVAYSCILYRSVAQVRAFLRLYGCLALPFQALIPLATWIFAEIRRHRERSRLDLALAASADGTDAAPSEEK